MSEQIFKSIANKYCVWERDRSGNAFVFDRLDVADLVCVQGFIGDYFERCGIRLESISSTDRDRLDGKKTIFPIKAAAEFKADIDEVLQHIHDCLVEGISPIKKLVSERYNGTSVIEESERRVAPPYISLVLNLVPPFSPYEKALQNKVVNHLTADLRANGSNITGSHAWSTSQMRPGGARTQIFFDFPPGAGPINAIAATEFLEANYNPRPSGQPGNKKGAPYVPRPR